jgi:hypothetical protein
MFEAFLRHQLSNNLEKIVERSLLNCHAEGLHSIMLLEKPEETIRLFVADKNHVLWKNNFINAGEYLSEEMSVGFHPHHCNVTLFPVKGMFANWIVEENNSEGDIEAIKYAYQSEITGGEIGFKFLHLCRLKTLSFEFHSSVLSPLGVPMKAREKHTVFVPKGKPAAWIVFEGAEDTNYQSVCYSNGDLTKKEKFAGLYQKPNASQIENVLSEAGLI